MSDSPAASPRQRRRQGRPVDADPAVTRQKIIDAALVCFGQHGYEGTTNQMIADRSDVSAATLYHYFDSKAAIFVTVGDEVSGEFRARVDERLTGTLSTNEQVAAIIGAVGDWFRERREIPLFWATYAADVARSREVLRISPRERWTRPIGFYAQIARDGQKAGDLAGDIDPEVFGGLVQGLIYGMATLIAVARNEELSDEVMEAFSRLVRDEIFLASSGRSDKPHTAQRPT